MKKNDVVSVYVNGEEKRGTIVVTNGKTAVIDIAGKVIDCMAAAIKVIKRAPEAVKVEGVADMDDTEASDSPEEVKQTTIKRRGRKPLTDKKNA
jgi:hypothetical protein